MSIFNCITDLTHWFSHNSIYLNMTKTDQFNSIDTIIFTTPSSPLLITHYFLLFLPTSQSITIVGFTISLTYTNLHTLII